MKYILSTLLLLLTITTQANDLFKFSVPDNMSIEGTYSSETEEDGSFHLIIMREKYKSVFVIKPVFINDENTIIDYEELSLSFAPTIISHHNSGGTSSFVIFNDKTKKLSVININRHNRSHTTTEIDDVKSPGLIFRLEDQTLMFDFQKKGKSLSFYKITSDNTIVNREIKVPEEYQDFIKQANLAVAINQNEFVAKGALNNVKAIVENDKLILSLDEEDDNLTKVLSISLDDSATFNLKKLTVSDSSIEKIKDYNSYLLDDKLYSIVTGKEDFEMRLFDIESQQLLNKLSLRDDINNANQDPQNLVDYLDYVAKGRIRPTITANKTKDGNLKITIDQADKTVHNYNYNWWWHHQMFHQQMMMQQRMMQQQMMQQVRSNLPTGFGPSVDFYDSNPAIYFKKKDPEPIVIILDTTGNLLPITDAETVFKNIDKEKNLEIFEEDKNYKNLSATFSSSEMRYMYQDRKSKDIFIKSQPIEE